MGSHRNPGKAEAEKNRLAKELAAAERWRAEQERLKRRRHDRDRRKRRRAEERERLATIARLQAENAAVLARLNPDDRNYRPQPIDALLVGKNRVTGLTAAAVKRKKTLTKAQWLAVQTGGAHR